MAPPPEAWTPLAELQAQHFLSPQRLDDHKPFVSTIRGQVAATRELQNVPAKDQPLHAGFIDLPQKLLDQYKRSTTAGLP